jgi:hypothetical protein
VIVRADLSAAQQAVQGIHAAIEAGRLNLIPADPSLPHPHLVFCTTADEPALELAARRLRVAGIGYAPFHEPDLDDSLTALCTVPVESEQRRHFRHYPLFVPSISEPVPCLPRR